LPSSPDSSEADEFIPGQEFTPAQSFTPGKSGFEPSLTAPHAGQSLNLIVHAVVGGIPFEIIDIPFEPR
jgi:hypothetical protein